MCAVLVSTTSDDSDLPCMHWILQHSKNPYKLCCIAGSAMCTTLSTLFTSILTAVKKGIYYSKTLYFVVTPKKTVHLDTNMYFVVEILHTLLKTITKHLPNTPKKMISK